jgi:hypothetical protein
LLAGEERVRKREKGAGERASEREKNNKKAVKRNFGNNNLWRRRK